MGKSDLINIREAAKGRWNAILRSLGFSERFISGQHVACVFKCGGDNGGKDRARYTNYEQNGCYWCNVCGKVDGIGLVMGTQNWTYPRTCREIEKLLRGGMPVEEDKDKPDPRIRLKEIEDGLQKVTHMDPVWRYLTNRGLSYIPETLKLHPALKYYEQQKDGKYKLICRFPAMVAKVTAWDGKPCTFHITYLDETGRKANVKVPKKTMPHLGNIEGSAIRLFKPRGGRLAVCEGIETAIAVFELLDKKVAVWPCRDANSLANFMFPEGIEVSKLSIYGDNDPKYAGQSAAYMLAMMASRKGKVVDVHIPNDVGRDFLDVRLGAAA